MFTFTSNILKNFLSQRATRRYPFETRSPFDGARGMLLNHIEKCNLCSICAVKCPSQCITVDRKASTWECDPFACVYCGICVDACPERALYQKPEYRQVAEKREMISLKGEIKKKGKKETDNGIESE